MSDLFYCFECLNLFLNLFCMSIILLKTNKVRRIIYIYIYLKYAYVMHNILVYVSIFILFIYIYKF